ncbi:hypothetical protein ACWFRJ_40155 [Streptomyces sp. NPDC055239]
MHTDAERAKAVAFVQGWQRWLSLHGLPAPAQAAVPALFRAPAAEPAGLFEDGLLLACMLLEREPALSWGDGPCLFLGHVHTLPHSSDDALRLISLWASDFAARLDLPHVRAEAHARPRLDTDPPAPVLNHLTDMGWNLPDPGTEQNWQRVVRLEIAAVHRPELDALVGYSVREPHPAKDGRRSAA